MQLGRVFGHYTPISYTTNPRVLKDFMGLDGDRTLFIIKNAVGTNICLVSACICLLPPESYPKVQRQATISAHSVNTLRKMRSYSSQYCTSE